MLLPFGAVLREHRLALQPLDQLCYYPGVVICAIEPQAETAGGPTKYMSVHYPVTVLVLVRQLERQLDSLVQPDGGVVSCYEQAAPGAIMNLAAGARHSPLVDQYRRPTFSTLAKPMCHEIP